MTAPNCCPRCLRNYEWETDGPFGIGKIHPVHPMGPCVPPPPFKPDEETVFDLDSRPQRALGLRECKGCGISFQPYRHFQIFCVKSCRNHLRNKLRALERIKDCVWCGKRFTGKLRSQKACSDACSRARRKEYHRLDWQRRNAA